MNKKTEKEFKVVFLGDQEVGKTSIIQRFVREDFNMKTQATNGVHYDQKQIELDEVIVNFKVWDTAGQERFRAINQLYYKDASVAVIVYDITNKNSFETLKYWVSELQQNGQDDVLITIVGNKQDLIENEQVPYDSARSYARDIGGILQLTSAKENKGIQELFRDIASMLHKGYKNDKKAKKQDPKDQARIKLASSKASFDASFDNKPNSQNQQNDKQKDKKKDSGCC